MSEQVKEYRIEGREPTIFRVMKNKDNPYVMVDRRPIDNPRLSYRAKGVLTYLLSRPDGWDVNIGDLANHGIEGRDALRAALTELREAGHLEYTQQREAGKFSTGHILVYEVPLTEPQTGNQYAVDEPQTDLPYTEEPHADNPTQVLSTLNRTDKKSGATTTTAQHPQNVYAVYESNIGPLTPLISDALKDHERTYGPDWVIRAIQEAAKMNARNLKYIEGVLNGYAQRGSPDIGRIKVKETRPVRTKTSAESNDDIVRRMARDAANNRR